MQSERQLKGEEGETACSPALLRVDVWVEHRQWRRAIPPDANLDKFLPFWFSDLVEHQLIIIHTFKCVRAFLS